MLAVADPIKIKRLPPEYRLAADWTLEEAAGADMFKLLQDNPSLSMLEAIKITTTESLNSMQRLGRIPGLELRMRKERPTRLIRTLQNLEREPGPKAAKRLLDFLERGDWSDPNEIAEIDSDLTKPSFRDYFRFWLKANMLSSPRPNEKNIFSNAFYQLYSITIGNPSRFVVDKFLGSRFMKAAFQDKMSDYQRTTYFKSILAAWKAPFSKGAFQKAIRLGGESLKTGKAPPDVYTKFAAEVGFRGNPFEHEQVPKFLKWMQAPVVFGRSPAWLLGLPFRPLVAADVAFRSLAMDSRVEELRTTESIQQNKPVGEIVMSDEMLQDAKDYAAGMVFMKKPGWTMQTAMTLRERAGILGDIVVPFLVTSINLTKAAVQRLPGLGIVISGQALKDKKYAEVFGQQLEGLVFTLLVLATYWDDDNLTGAPPKNAAERDAWFRRGMQAYSIRFPGTDKWVSYQYVEPMNIWLGSILAFRDTVKEGLVKDEEKALMFANAGIAVTTYLVRTSFLDNALRLYARGENVITQAAKVPGNLVPYSAMWRFINDNLERATTDGRTLRESQDFLSSFVHTLPFGDAIRAKYGNQPRTRLNAMGEDIVIPGGALQLWIPFSWRSTIQDDVEDALKTHTVYPGLPGKTLKVGRDEHTLSDLEYWEYCQLYGAHTKKELKKIVAQPRYKRANPERQLELLNSAITKGRNRARVLAVRALRRQRVLPTGLDRRISL